MITILHNLTNTTLRAIVAPRNNAPETTRDLARTLRIKRAELQPVLQRDSRKQAESYASAEFHKRIARYLPDHDDAA